MVFVGTKALGDSLYGYEDGTVWPQEPPFPPEGPGERGWWSDSFVGEILFYDTEDLAAVARGTMAAHAPQPYAAMNVDPVLYHISGTRQWHHLAAAAYDRGSRLLYVIEPFGDEDDKPLVLSQLVFDVRMGYGLGPGKEAQRCLQRSISSTWNAMSVRLSWL